MANPEQGTDSHKDLVITDIPVGIITEPTGNSTLNPSHSKYLEIAAALMQENPEAAQAIEAFANFAFIEQPGKSITQRINGFPINDEELPDVKLFSDTYYEDSYELTTPESPPAAEYRNLDIIPNKPALLQILLKPFRNMDTEQVANIFESNISITAKTEGDTWKRWELYINIKDNRAEVRAYKTKVDKQAKEPIAIPEQITFLELSDLINYLKTAN